MPVPSIGVNCEKDRRVEWDDEGNVVELRGEHRGDTCCVLRLVARGVTWADHGSPGKCTVCGASFAHGDVWKHDATGAHIHVGWECSEKYGMLVDHTAHEMALLHARSLVRVELSRVRNEQERREFLAAHPGLEDALKVDHRTTRDLAQSFQTYRHLSDKQLDLAFKLAEDAKNPPPAEVLVPAPVSEGRQWVEGVVVSVKLHASAYGETWKMTVKVTTPAGVWLTWGTRPTSLDEARRGDRVKFQAALKAGRDAHFALFSRPSKAVVVKEAGPPPPRPVDELEALRAAGGADLVALQVELRAACLVELGWRREHPGMTAGELYAASTDELRRLVEQQRVTGHRA
jgi:hypothetical protein